MKKWTQSCLAIAILLASAVTHAAAYRVEVDTQSVSQQNGFIYFSLGSLLGSPAIDAQISQLTGWQSLGAIELQDGQVSGALPSKLILSSNSPSSFVAQGLTFGQKLSFVLNFGGDWQGTPSADGSSFVAQLLDQNYTPLLGNASGSIFHINAVAHTPMQPELGLSTQVAPVPEPETYALMGLGLLALIARRKRQY